MSGAARLFGLYVLGCLAGFAVAAGILTSLPADLALAFLTLILGVGCGVAAMAIFGNQP